MSFHLSCRLLRETLPGIGSARNFAFSSTGKQRKIKIVEVGPRDGLQNEKSIISTHTKVDLIERLAHSGLQTIEAGSFVSPKWVPQVAHNATAGAWNLTPLLYFLRWREPLKS